MLSLTLHRNENLNTIFANQIGKNFKNLMTLGVGKGVGKQEPSCAASRRVNV